MVVDVCAVRQWFYITSCILLSILHLCIYSEKRECPVKRELSDSSNSSSGTTKTTSTTDEDLEQSETLVTYWKGKLTSRRLSSSQGYCLILRPQIKVFYFC